MGQREVLKFLKDERKKSNRWITIYEIRDALKSNGSLRHLNNNLYKLYMFGMIETKGVGLWQHHKEFRYLQYGK